MPEQCALDLSLPYLNIYKADLANIMRGATIGFSGEDITACIAGWQADWQAIYAKRIEPDFYFRRPRDDRNFWDNLTELDLELVNRTAFDMALTHFVTEGRTSFKAPKGVCYYKTQPWSFLRADNVSFVLKSGLIDQIKAHTINKDVQWHVWYITQHADLQPYFQKYMLSLFEEHAEANNFPEYLLNSLRGRVKNNLKYYE